MAVIRGKFLLREDIWFDEKPANIPQVDVVYYYYQATPPVIPEIEFDEEYTLLLDLQQEQSKIWENIKRENRYKIRKAVKKDELIHEYWNKINFDVINCFWDFYNQFALQQGLKKLKKIEIERLVSYAKSGVLHLSRVTSKDGKTLAWRAYYYNKNRVINLHSASLKNYLDPSYNQMIGRANRYHCWQDILKFKSLGALLYDFGGLYVNTANQHLLNINQFKEEFAGEVVRTFNWRQGVTLKGKLFLQLRKILVSSPSHESTNSLHRLSPEFVN